MPWCSREDQQQHRAIRIPGQKDPEQQRLEQDEDRLKPVGGHFWAVLW